MGARYFIDRQAVRSPQASRLCMNFDSSTTIEGRGECLLFCVTSFWFMLLKRSYDDDDIESSVGRAFEGLRAA